MRPITDVLRDIRKGRAVEQATRLLAEVVRAVDETGKPGELTLKIKVKPEKGGGSQKTILCEVKAKKPEGDIPEAVRLLVGTYEDWGDEVLHLLSQERGLAGVSDRVEAGRRYHAAWVERAFSSLLRKLPPAVRRRRIGELVAVTDIYCWKVLRRDVGLSRAEVEASLRELVGDIVARGEK